MADILNMGAQTEQVHPKKLKSDPNRKFDAEIIIFPGVRYQRQENSGSETAE